MLKTGLKSHLHERQKQSDFVDLCVLSFKLLHEAFVGMNVVYLFKISIQIMLLVYGQFMASLWLVYGQFMASLWLVYGQFMASLWLVYGQFMASLWLVYGQFMAFYCIFQILPICKCAHNYILPKLKIFILVNFLEVRLGAYVPAQSISGYTFFCSHSINLNTTLNINNT